MNRQEILHDGFRLAGGKINGLDEAAGALGVHAVPSFPPAWRPRARTSTCKAQAGAFSSRPGRGRGFLGRAEPRFRSARLSP